jgi:hypothetical protein
LVVSFAMSGLLKVAAGSDAKLYFPTGARVSEVAHNPLLSQSHHLSRMCMCLCISVAKPRPPLHIQLVRKVEVCCCIRSRPPPLPSLSHITAPASLSPRFSCTLIIGGADGWNLQRALHVRVVLDLGIRTGPSLLSIEETSNTHDAHTYCHSHVGVAPRSIFSNTHKPHTQLHHISVLLFLNQLHKPGFAMHHSFLTAGEKKREARQSVL